MTYDELQQLPTGTPVVFGGKTACYVRHDIKPVAWYNQGTQPVSKQRDGHIYFCAPYESLSAQA